MAKKDVARTNIPGKARVSGNFPEKEQNPVPATPKIAGNQIRPAPAGPKEPPAASAVTSLPDQKIAGGTTGPYAGNSISQVTPPENPPRKKTGPAGRITAGNTSTGISAAETSPKPSVPKDIKDDKDRKTQQTPKISVKKQEKASENKIVEKEKPAGIPVKSPVAVKPVRNSIEKVKFIKWPQGFKMSMVTAHGIGKYNHFFLDGPPKLVLDIKGKWKSNTDSVFRLKNDLVKQVRIGEHDEFIRIVFDLKAKKPPLPEFVKSDNGLIVTLKLK